MQILLVEDEANIRRAVSLTLTSWGHSVETEGTVATALQRLRRAPFDLVILDINLPDATGWDVMRELADRQDDPPLTIVITALPPRAERVREFQPFAILHKPFPIDALRRLVNKAELRLRGDEPEPMSAREFGFWG